MNTHGPLSLVLLSSSMLQTSMPKDVDATKDSVKIRKMVPVREIPDLEKSQTRTAKKSMGAVCEECSEGFGVESFQHMTCVKLATKDSNYRCIKIGGVYVCDAQIANERINEKGEVVCRYGLVEGGIQPVDCLHKNSCDP